MSCKKKIQPRQLLSVLLVCALFMSCVIPGLAANETAKTVQLMKTEGTVSLKNSSGKKLSVRDSMRLYNGYLTGTEQASYAWFNLDSAKLSKLDEASEMELRKSGKKLELLLNSGNLYFNVTEPLETDETLNIRTSTMVVGIRGTCGWVQVVDQWHSRLYVLEGRVTCSVTDPVTGQTKTTVLTGGEWASFVVYPQNRTGDKCDIIRQQKFTEPTIPGFIRTELAGNLALCEKIFQDSGLDLRNLTAGEALQRLHEDQAAMAARLNAGKQQQSAQESHVSTDPVWDETVNSNAGGSSGGSGSSGGGSGITPPPSGITNTTPTTTQALTMTMPVTIPQIQSALNQASASSVTVNPGTGNNVLTQAANETLTVPANKTLTLASGVDLVENGTLNVNGTMNVNGNLDNYGTITVTSPNSLHVSGYFNNHAGGVVNNISSGHIVPAQGIQNYGTITTRGNAVLESGAAATVDNYATLNLTGGTISNNGSGGSAIKMETGTSIPATFTASSATNIWSKSSTPVADANGGTPDIGGYKVITNNDQTTLRPTGGVEGGVLTYSVSYDANGGRWPGNVATSITVERNTALGAPPSSPSRTGYTFAGWQDAGGKAYTNSDIVTSDLTLYAQWTANSGTETPGKVTITFDPNGGTLSTSASVEIDRGGSLPYLPAEPTREGYTFDGWNGLQNTYSVNTTLTAQWTAGGGTETPEKVTVTFMARKNYNSEDRTYITIEVDEGGSLPYLPSDPGTIRSNYTPVFVGWYYIDTQGFEQSVHNSTPFWNDTEVHAKYTYYPLITFNLYTEGPDGLTGGGKWDGFGNRNLRLPTKDAPSAAALDDRDSAEAFPLYTVPLEPTKEGYRFIGWTTEDPAAQDSSGDRYTSEDLWSAKFTEPTTLYPVWRLAATDPGTSEAKADLYLNDGVTAEDIRASLAVYDEVTIHPGSSDPNNTQDAETTLTLTESLTIPERKVLYLDEGVSMDMYANLFNCGGIFPTLAKNISDVSSLPPCDETWPTLAVHGYTVFNFGVSGKCGIAVGSFQVENGGITNYSLIYSDTLTAEGSFLENLLGGLIDADVVLTDSGLRHSGTINGNLTVTHNRDNLGAFLDRYSEVTGDVVINGLGSSPNSDFRSNIFIDSAYVGSYTQNGGCTHMTGDVIFTADHPSFTLNGGVIWIDSSLNTDSSSKKIDKLSVSGGYLYVYSGYIPCPIEQTNAYVTITGGTFTYEAGPAVVFNSGDLTISGGEFTGGKGIQTPEDGANIELSGGAFKDGIIYQGDDNAPLTGEEELTNYLKDGYTVHRGYVKYTYTSGGRTFFYIVPKPEQT